MKLNMTNPTPLKIAVLVSGSGSNLQVLIDKQLQQKGHIEQMEMYRTFNCGVGFVVVVPADKADQAIDLLNEQGETAWKLGEIVERTGDAVTYR